VAEWELALEQAGRLKAIYEQGITAGWGEYDFIGLVRLLERGPG